jgi:starch phosphorylase
VVNNDPRTRDLLQVVFIPNYGVSVAELIMPAANLSEQISTAGTEASGTGNMKLSLNGALTIGTEDGANIEIRDNVGAENIFIFGNNTAQVNAIRQAGHQPLALYQADPALKEALDRIDSGFFSPGERPRYHDIFNSLLHYGDHYLLLADYADLRGHASACRCALPEPRRVAAQGHSQCRRDGSLLGRPDDPRLRQRHLESTPTLSKEVSNA